MNWEQIIAKIEESENINQLPLIKDLIDENQNYDTEEICENWDCKGIKIKDDTVVQLEKYSGNCFNDKNGHEHWYFYHIKTIEIYICAECGQWQKDYDIDWFLPYDWNELGIQSYIKKGEDIKTSCKISDKAICECDTCIHFDECECDFEGEECYEWEGN